MGSPVHRHSGSWMVIWDDRILEIMLSQGPATASKIANRDFIHVGRSNISKRLSKLEDHGLIQPYGNGVYHISALGRAYLYGGYDAESGEEITYNSQNERPTLDWVESYLEERDAAKNFSDYLHVLYRDGTSR